jgi:hypothetical protein
MVLDDREAEDSSAPRPQAGRFPDGHLDGARAGRPKAQLAVRIGAKWSAPDEPGSADVGRPLRPPFDLREQCPHGGRRKLDVEHPLDEDSLPRIVGHRAASVARMPGRAEACGSPSEWGPESAMADGASGVSWMKAAIARRDTKKVLRGMSRTHTLGAAAGFTHFVNPVLIDPLDDVVVDRQPTGIGRSGPDEVQGISERHFGGVVAGVRFSGEPCG